MSNVRAWLGFLALGCWSLNCGGSTTTESGGGAQAGGGAGEGSGGTSGNPAGAAGSASTAGAAGSGVAGSTGTGMAGSTGSGTGGAGGTTATVVDASVSSDGSAVGFDASDCNCVPAPVRWGNDGGNARYTEQSEVSPCRTYSRSRDFGGNAPPVTCKEELLACGSNSIGIGDLTAALRNADVQQAFRSAPVLYGTDPRPADGTVFRVVIAGAVVDIGGPCAGGGGCKAIPPGVAALAEMLSLLDKQELGRSPCSTTFPQ